MKVKIFLFSLLVKFDKAALKLVPEPNHNPEVSLLSVLKLEHIIHELIPLQSSELSLQTDSERVFKYWFKLLKNPEEGVNQVRNFYGDKVAIYFEWLRFTSQLLTYPALLGLAVYFISHFQNIPV